MFSRQSIQEDLKQSMLKKNELRTGTLRMLLAAVSNKEKEKRYKMSKAEPNLSEQELQAKSELSLQEVQDAVSSEVKKRREAAEGFEKGGRKEQAEKERQEMEILLPYLPTQLSEDEIRQLVKDVIAKVRAAGPQDFGKVMGVLAPQTRGKADGNLVSKIVKELLTLQ
ncbi:MAG: GatB/YqeY domain-containing protein [bacterium]|nr:GatB/YqeY domain-containing protein [bacterium]